MQTLLQRGNSGWIMDLPTRCSIGYIESIDCGAFFRTDSGEGDGDLLLAEGRQQFIEQSQAIRGLNLNKGVDRMRLIFNGYPSGEIHFASGGSVHDFAACPFE